MSQSNHEPSTSPEMPPAYESALERTRSAIWPLLLALGVGVAVGFAGGYGVGSRDRTMSPAPGLAVAAQAPSEARKEFTDATVKPDDRTVRPQADAKQPPSEVQLKPDATADRRPVPSPEPAPPEPGRLLVRSTPAGARVTVDGRDAGETPAVVRDLNRGAHSVRISRDGYAPVERRVVISAARPALAITVPLERERAVAARGVTSTAPVPETPGTTGRFMGALSIESRPTGAKVFFDGRLIGTTPLAMPSVAAGEHAVRLERDGYRHWTSSVRVVASEQNRVTASLER